MGNLKFFILFSCILPVLFLLSFNKYFDLKNLQSNKTIFERKVNIYGQVYLKEGNYMPSISQKEKIFQDKEKYFMDKYVLAVEGKIKREEKSPEIDIDIIKNKIYKTKTNESGKFTFLLKPGIYTFFIMNENKAYLNKFDGQGFFQTQIINRENNKIELIYEKYSLY